MLTWECVPPNADVLRVSVYLSVSLSICLCVSVCLPLSLISVPSLSLPPLPFPSLSRSSPLPHTQAAKAAKLQLRHEQAVQARSAVLLRRRCPVNTKGYPSTYLAMGFADVRAGTQT